MDSYRSKHLHTPDYHDVLSRDSQAYLVPRYTDRKRAWYSFQRGPKSPSAEGLMSALKREADYLWSQTKEQELEISHLKKKLHMRDQQQADLQAKWNFHSFKYQLLIDMWAMRVLDNESDADYP